MIARVRIIRKNSIVTCSAAVVHEAAYSPSGIQPCVPKNAPTMQRLRLPIVMRCVFLVSRRLIDAGRHEPGLLLSRRTAVCVQLEELRNDGRCGVDDVSYVLLRDVVGGSKKHMVAASAVHGAGAWVEGDGEWRLHCWRYAGRLVMYGMVGRLDVVGGLPSSCTPIAIAS